MYVHPSCIYGDYGIRCTTGILWYQSIQWTVFIIIVPNNAHQHGSWLEQFLGKTATYTILLFLHALYEGYSSNCGQK